MIFEDAETAFIWDRRRVSLCGMVGFKAGDHRITLLTAHIRYGRTPEDRLPELEKLAALGLNLATIDPLAQVG